MNTFISSKLKFNSLFFYSFTSFLFLFSYYMFQFICNQDCFPITNVELVYFIVFGLFSLIMLYIAKITGWLKQIIVFYSNKKNLFSSFGYAFVGFLMLVFIWFFYMLKLKKIDFYSNVNVNFSLLVLTNKVIIAAFAEELFFRTLYPKFIQKLWSYITKDKFEKNLLILFVINLFVFLSSSAFFAIVHDLRYFGLYFTFGVFLLLIRYVGGVYASMLSHSWYNLFIYVIFLML